MRRVVEACINRLIIRLLLVVRVRLKVRRDTVVVVEVAGGGAGSGLVAQGAAVSGLPAMPEDDAPSAVAPALHCPLPAPRRLLPAASSDSQVPGVLPLGAPAVLQRRTPAPAPAASTLRLPLLPPTPLPRHRQL